MNAVRLVFQSVSFYNILLFFLSRTGVAADELLIKDTGKNHLADENPVLFEGDILTDDDDDDDDVDDNGDVMDASEKMANEEMDKSYLVDENLSLFEGDIIIDNDDGDNEEEEGSERANEKR